ncbi:MAG TPA: glycosyltransferase family 2 protein [bacterium]|nr:glycosyltransferase [Chlamydiota bacterium]HOE27557.1 glycosyltransferase family 2 protein [bacterium]HQM52504.1 glycosyltransferase family 2 protein [bacterium]
MEKGFSVVTCCYNQARYLRDNIESVLAQRWPGFEHIVVDDGSTDETAAVCARYPHVRYLRQENAGQSAALNRGFREARGEIIAWLNSDDYYEQGAFERVAREIGRLRTGYLVTGAVRRVDEAGAEILTLLKGTVPFYRLLLHPRIHSINGRTSMPCQPSTFFHRELFEKLGPLDTTLVYAMDYDFWLRAFEAGYRFLYVPQIFSNYRFHATSHSNQGWETFMGEWTAVSERHYRALTPLRRRLADCWAGYLRLETAVLRRVRAARNA